MNPLVGIPTAPLRERRLNVHLCFFACPSGVASFHTPAHALFSCTLEHPPTDTRRIVVNLRVLGPRTAEGGLVLRRRWIPCGLMLLSSLSLASARAQEVLPAFVVRPGPTTAAPEQQSVREPPALPINLPTALQLAGAR